jgi:hypothetical protein
MNIDPTNLLYAFPLIMLIMISRTLSEIVDKLNSFNESVEKLEEICHSLSEIERHISDIEGVVSDYSKHEPHPLDN